MERRFVKVEKGLGPQGHIAVVRFDRGDNINALSRQAMRELRDVPRDFEDDLETSVIILTGSAKAFSAGFDLKDHEGAKRGGLPLGESLLNQRLGPRLCKAWEQLEQVTIAAIEGWCVAGGLELALWCDLRICTADSRFGCLERRWGVPLIDGGTQRLPRIIGLGRALDLVLTGRVVAADEAERIGLVTQVVEPEQHLVRALALAETLAAFPQEAMLADRRSTIEGIGRTFEDGLWLEARRGVPTVASSQAGAARFADGAGRSGRSAD